MLCRARKEVYRSVAAVDRQRVKVAENSDVRIILLQPKLCYFMYSIGWQLVHDPLCSNHPSHASELRSSLPTSFEENIARVVLQAVAVAGEATQCHIGSRVRRR